MLSIAININSFFIATHQNVRNRIKPMGYKIYGKMQFTENEKAIFIYLFIFLIMFIFI